MAGSSKKPNVTERAKSSKKKKIEVKIPDFNKALARMTLASGLTSDIELKEGKKVKRQNKKIKGPKPKGSWGFTGNPVGLANIILDAVRKKK